MASLRFLTHRLSPFVVRTAVLPGQDACPDRIELLSPTQKLLRADRVHLMDVRDAAMLVGVQAAPGAVVLFAGGERAGLMPSLPDGCGGVLFSCSLAMLHNTLADIIASSTQWREAFRALSDEGASLPAIIELTAQLAEDAAFLLDHTGRVLASAGLEHSPWLAGLTANGLFSPELLERIFAPAQPAALTGAYPVPGQDLVLCGQRLPYGPDGTFGTLLVAGRKDRPVTDTRELCGYAVQCLERHISSRSLEQVDSGTWTFQRCWEDIMEGRLTGSAEIRETLSRMVCPVKAFVRVAVISFADGGSGVPYNYILAQLGEIFPDTNMTVYRKNILLLLSHEERIFRLELDSDRRLGGLLERYDGFMSVSNGSRQLKFLRTAYLIAVRTMMLAQRLRRDRNQRVFFHEDYSVYYLIDLCVKRYMEIEGNEDPLYLMHPAVIFLTRYDRANNSNLRDVLFYYLINDRSLVKTAAATYMHRNTVINKINKITDLLKLDFEDGQLRQRLLLSCQIIRYYELVMQQEFRP